MVTNRRELSNFVESFVESFVLYRLLVGTESRTATSKTATHSLLKNTINISLSFLQGLGAQASYSEVKEKEEKVGLPSQTAPKNPRGQMHLNAPGISVQVAPFLQGFDAQ